MFYLRFLCFTVALISMGGMHPASVFHAQSTQPAGTDTQLDLTPAEVYALLDQFVDIHMSGKTDEAKPLLQKARRAINAFDESERQTGLGLVCQARYQWYSGDQYSASYTFY